MARKTKSRVCIHCKKQVKKTDSTKIFFLKTFHGKPINATQESCYLCKKCEIKLKGNRAYGRLW